MLPGTDSAGAESVEFLEVSHDVDEQKGVDCGVTLQRRKNRDSSGSRDRGIPSCTSSAGRR